MAVLVIVPLLEMAVLVELEAVELEVVLLMELQELQILAEAVVALKHRLLVVQVVQVLLS